jgi:hypothetical protein
MIPDTRGKFPWILGCWGLWLLNLLTCGVLAVFLMDRQFGHAWKIRRINGPKSMGLGMVSELAGVDAICRRCRAEWWDSDLGEMSAVDRLADLVDP